MSIITVSEPYLERVSLFVSWNTILISSVTAYTDTTIVFSEPVPGLDKGVTIKYMACADSITSPDQGKTWKIPHIKVDKSNAPLQFVKGAKVSGKGGGLCSQR